MLDYKEKDYDPETDHYVSERGGNDDDGGPDDKVKKKN